MQLPPSPRSVHAPMVKKKFGGEKVDVKGVLAPEPKPAASSGPAWAKGAGAAAVASPSQAAALAAVAPKTGAPPVGGSWARGGPQGLAATATSVQAAAQPKFAAAARPKPAGFATGSLRGPALGQRRDLGPAGPAFGDEAFPEAERAKTSVELAQEKAAAAAASAFPEVAFGKEALAALAKASGIEASPASALDWLLRSGIPEACKGRDAVLVRDRLLAAGALVIQDRAPQAAGAAEVTAVLEAYFADKQKSGKSSPAIVEADGLIDAQLFGALALHMEDVAKAASIRERLVRRLLKATTSEPVQRALAEALVALIARADAGEGSGSAAAERISQMCLQELANASDGTRRGAALGAAAAAQAGGPAIRKASVEAVKAAVSADGKSAAGRRHGGLLCLAELATNLGRAFEPHALAFLPLLLQSCADEKKEVYLAGRAASQKVVSQVSTNCMKLMVKPVLEGIRSKQWRGQLAALELFGTIVAELSTSAPKRLAMLMPEAVPALCEAVASPRAEVRDAVKSVFEKVVPTIGHRDVAGLAPQLIAALADPSEKPIVKALDALLSAVFTTAIDAAACALVCPVVERALSRGDAEAQQKAASFARGLVLHAGESEELVPFFTVLRPPLEALLAHPNPGVRDAAAQAIGALVGEGAAASHSELLGRLDAKQDGAEMEGTAQGIAAAMANVSDEARAEMLAELIRIDVAKEGRLCRLCVFAHLPKALGSSAEATRTLAEGLPVLVSALAASDEAVRVMARRALDAAADAARGPALAAALACALAEALRDEDARARLAAAELAVSFVTSRVLAADPESRSALVAAAVVAQADHDAAVRRVADRAWRAATEGGGGTPGKQLKELRPQLVEAVLESLASGAPERGRAAGRAAALLQERLESSGGFVEALAPGLRDALYAADLDAQISACAGFAELLKSPKCHKAVIDVQALAEAVRGLLLSDEAAVADAAARCAAAAPPAFVSEPLVQELCAAVEAPSVGEEAALQALVRADGAGGAVMRLLVAGAADGRGGRAARCACLGAAAAAPATALRQVVAQAAEAFLLLGRGAPDDAARAVRRWAAGLDAEGAREFVAELMAAIERTQPDAQSEVAAVLIGAFVEAASAPPAEAAELLDALLPGALLAPSRGAGREEAFSSALQAVVQAVGAGALAELGPPRVLAALAAAPAAQEVAFCSRAFEALAPVLQAAVLSGVATQRRAALDALVPLTRGVGADTLQGQAMKMAGPLVRALGEKAADAETLVLVLRVLTVLLERAGSTLKALKAALVTAFVKGLEGPEGVRAAATAACAALAVAEPKVVAKTLGKAPLKAQNLEALAVVLAALAQDAKKEADEDARAALVAARASGEEAVRAAGERVAAALGC